MNKEEALRKIEEFVKELDKKEENYCVGSHKNVEFDRYYKNLLFENGCEINSSPEGDGVFVDKDFVKLVGLTGDGHIEIILKGSDKTKDYYNKILWGCGE